MRRLRRPPPTAPDLLGVLDPAKRRCGLAIFIRGELVYAATLHGSGPPDVARKVNGALKAYGELFGKGVAHIVAEIPRTYTNARAKDPHLLGLRQLVTLIDGLVAIPVFGVYPQEWKGSVPKGICEQRIRGVLSDIELRAMSDTGDDAFDAVGLGLWYLRRAGRGMETTR